MIKKVIAIVFIVLGSLLILFGLLMFLTTSTGKGPSSDDPAFVFGYYFAPFFILIPGAILLFVGIRMRKKVKRKKLKKDLLDSLPG